MSQGSQSEASLSLPLTSIPSTGCRKIGRMTNGRRNDLSLRLRSVRVNAITDARDHGERRLRRQRMEKTPRPR